MTDLHDRLAKHLQHCLNTAIVPLWMTKGRTVLIMKDNKKDNVVSKTHNMFTHYVEIFNRNH